MVTVGASQSGTVLRGSVVTSLLSLAVAPPSKRDLLSSFGTVEVVVVAVIPSS